MSAAMHEAATAHLPGVERLLPLQVIMQVLQDRWGGVKIFVVFVVERQTMKFLPTKQYCTVRRLHTYCTATTKIFPKNSLLTKILPPDKYPLYGMHVTTTHNDTHWRVL